MPAQFENSEKSEGSKLLASIHTIQEQFDNCTKFDGKNLIAGLTGNGVRLLSHTLAHATSSQEVQQIARLPFPNED